MSASYPSSAKTFVTRNAGDIIQPAHINDVQDEVNAVETALLSGIAHDLVPGTNNTRDLGTNALRWAELHVTSITLAGTALTPQTLMTFSAGSQGTQAQAVTQYYTASFYGPTENQIEGLIAGTVTFTKLYLRTGAAVGGAGQTVTATLRQNGADTAITCSIASGAQTGNDTAHSVTFAAGDRITLKVVTSATTGAVQVMAGIG